MSRRCFVSHMGLWLYEPLRFRQAAELVLHGYAADGADFESGPVEPPPVHVTPGGIAIVPIDGPLMKGASKFGGTSTVHTRQTLRALASNGSVRGIMLDVDSPGGHVAGTKELADEVVTTQATKPVWAAVSDLGASAAYWVASSAERISVNETGEVGSIGTMAMLVDTAEAFEKEGVKVHVVTTAPFKAVGAPGVEITEEHLAYVQGRVEEINAFFQDAVRAGRGLSAERLAAVSDGKVFGSAESLALGLVDDIRSIEDSVAAMTRTLDLAEGRQRASQARANMARRRLDSMGA